ncbi:aspartic peptidase domain-containing protein [Fennellomyces sp. T-0311]|nr:aspartic peptidase domain-containing protein [Fennellomyces sp. T-0311]
MLWSLSSVLAALTASVVVAQASDGLISIPFVAVDRKAARIPTWKFQKLGSTVNVPLENIDLAYLMEMSIGTPPQPFTLLLDTGSSTTWVPLEGCGRLCGYPRHTMSPKKSSSFELANLPFSIRYGEGFSRGVYARDTVTLNNAVSVPNASFALSDFNDGELSRDGAVDGILGIGPDVLSRYNNPNDQIVPTLVSSMHQAGVIANNSFSIYFKTFDGATSDNRVNGDIIFGGGKY